MRASCLITAILVGGLAAGQDEPRGDLRVVFSADTHGQLLTCATCPDASAPGLAQRGTALAALRDHDEVVLLDAGNAVHGHQTSASEGAALLAGYAALRYDAVHLSVRDLLPDSQRTRALLATSRTPFVSSNLVDDLGRPLAAPWLVVSRAGLALGILGFSETPPASSPLLPSLGDQHVVPPAEALARWLPEVKKHSARVLVLCAGTAAWITDLQRQLAGMTIALLCAGDDSRNVPLDMAPPALVAPARGRGLRSFRMAADSSTLTNLETVPIPTTLAESRAVVDALLPFLPGAGATSGSLVQELVQEKADQKQLELPIPLGATQRLRASAANSKMALMVHSLRTTKKYGTHAANPDEDLLVLDVELANARSLETEPDAASLDLAIKDLGSMLRAIVDGDNERELVLGAEDLPGHLPRGGVVLGFRARPLRGNLVFAIPQRLTASLALRARVEGALDLTIVLAASRAAPPAKPAPEPLQRKPLGLAGHGITPEQIAKAIQNAAEFAWKRQRTIPARTAAESSLASHETHLLTLLALTHADFVAQNRECAAYLKEVLSRMKPTHTDVYQAALLVMLVEAIGDLEFLPLARAATRYLVEAQGENGTWTYTANVPSELLADFDKRVLQVTGGEPLDSTPRDLLACERTRKFDPAEDGDNSCTQFALLGLRSAARLSVKVPSDTWLRARKAILQRQRKDGSFGYTGSETDYPTGSMTSAGISALAITGHELGLAKPAEDAAIQKAVRWLDEQFTIATNPGGGYHAYWRYGIERIGRFLESDFIGKHEWYPLGARHLVDTQKPDGSFCEVETEAMQDTAFGLLFLTRATATLKVQLARGGTGMLLTGVRPGTPARFYVILDASGSMLEAIDGRTKFDTAKQALTALLAILPEECEVALRVYGHRTRALDPGADEDSELVVPMQKIERPSFAATLASLRARGKTPLAFSLEQAGSDLGEADPAKPVTVLLLTDGGEDPQSKRDPRLCAQKLCAKPGIALHVVGFDINRADWSKQLEEVARRGHGTYWPARKGSELERSLRATVLKLPDTFVVTDGSAKEVARGAFGTSCKLPEGRYRLVTHFAGRELATEFWINTDVKTSVVFDGNQLDGR